MTFIPPTELIGVLLSIPHTIEEAKAAIDALPRNEADGVTYPVYTGVILNPVILPDSIMEQAQKDAFLLWNYIVGQLYTWEECANKSFWRDQVYDAGLAPNAPINNAEDLGSYHSLLINISDAWIAPTGQITNTLPIRVGDSVVVEALSGSNWPISVTDSGTGTTLYIDAVGNTVSFVTTATGSYTITLADGIDPVLKSVIDYTVEASESSGNPPTASVMNSNPIYAGSVVSVQLTAADNFPVSVIDNRNGSQQSLDQVPSVAQITYDAAGSYTITVQDSVTLLTTTLEVVIVSATEPLAPTFNISDTQYLQVTITVSSSSAWPVTVDWGDGSSTVTVEQNSPYASYTYGAAGTYTITVTDTTNNLSATDEAIVTAAVAPTFNTDKTDLTVTVTAKTAENWPVSVDWGDGSSVDSIAAAEGTKDHTYASGGTYTITVQDASNEQTATKNVIVTAPVAPTFETDKTDLTVTVTAKTAENFPVSVDWGDGTAVDSIAAADGTKDHTYASANTYTITVTDASNGQTATKNVTVTDPVAPVFDAETTQLVVTVTSTSAENYPVSVDWGDGSSTDTIAAAAGTKDHTYVAGTYTITVTDASNGQSATKSVTPSDT